MGNGSDRLDPLTQADHDLDLTLVHFSKFSAIFTRWTGWTCCVRFTGQKSRLIPVNLKSLWTAQGTLLGLAFSPSFSGQKALSRQIYGLEGKRKVNQRDCVQ